MKKKKERLLSHCHTALDLHLQHSATHCGALHHTATHTATLTDSYLVTQLWTRAFNAFLARMKKKEKKGKKSTPDSHTALDPRLQHTATHCGALQHTAAHTTTLIDSCRIVT